MNTTASPSTSLSPIDFYYLSVASNIFRYGYLTVMCIGFFGNTCQIITFSRKTMRHVSTGVFFLALSISDLTYLLLCTYVLVIFGFQQSDQSNQTISCRIRHFSNNLATNFSAWMLMLISCDRWIRTQFPLRAQQICTPKKAISAIIIAIVIDALLHVHLLTPLFGPVGSGPTGSSCGANRFYTTYVYFYTSIWPIISITTVTILPATMMILFLVATMINIQSRRNRVAPVQQNQSSSHNTRRMNYMHRQMFIMMMMTFTLFFIASLPVALYRFSSSTLGFRLPAALNLLLTATFGMITASNYALNFYLHCLTSKLYRKEFYRSFRCQAYNNIDKTTINLAEFTTAHRNVQLYAQNNKLQTTHDGLSK